MSNITLTLSIWDIMRYLGNISAHIDIKLTAELNPLGTRYYIQNYKS